MKTTPELEFYLPTENRSIKDSASNANFSNPPYLKLEALPDTFIIEEKPKLRGLTDCKMILSANQLSTRDLGKLYYLKAQGCYVKVKTEKEIEQYIGSDSTLVQIDFSTSDGSKINKTPIIKLELSYKTINLR